MFGLYGNEKIRSVFEGTLFSGKPAGCYIIEGPGGSGKLTIARWAAATLLCQDRAENAEACGKCRSCRNILYGQYVDVNELIPQDTEKNIPIDRVRDFLKSSYIAPSEGDWRVFIIVHSERLRKDAQNTLLKIIEEPPKNTVFFLLTEDKTALLPTVRSRAVKLATSPLSEKELAEVLASRGYGEEKIKDLPPDVFSVGAAEKYFSSDEDRRKRETVTDYFRKIADGASFSVLSSVISPAKTTRSDLSDYLSMIKLASRDIVSKSLYPEISPMFFKDDELLFELSQISSPGKAVKLAELCDRLLESASLNVNVFSAVSELNLCATHLTGF